MREGDVLNIQDELTKEVRAYIVTKLVFYRDLETYLENEGLENCLPGVKTIPEGVEKYLSLGWTLDEIKTYGVLAMRIEKY